MSRGCTICAHPRVDEINGALAARRPYRGIAARFGASEKAVYRHGQNHLSATLVEAAKTSKRVANVIRAESIVEKIAALEGEARRLQATAEEAGDVRAALVALRELRETLAAWSKLVPATEAAAPVNPEEMQEWQTVFEVLSRPEHEATRRAIDAALSPFGQPPALGPSHEDALDPANVEP